MRLKSNQGLTVVEMLVGSAIIAAFMLATITVFSDSLGLNSRNLRSVQATYLAEEGVEALKLMRDESWSSKIAALSPDTDYYLEFDGANWKATTTMPAYLDGRFDRRFRLSTVYRHSTSKDIVDSGSADASTTKAVVSVSWAGASGTTTRSISAYLTNIFKN